MSTEKPKKRLVGWKQYVWTKLQKGLGYTGATAIACLAMLFLMLCVVLTRSLLGPAYVGATLLGSIILAFAAFVTICFATLLFKHTKRIEPVVLITRHNTGDLPAVETLVRASDLPPSHQQAELLRAAPQGSETPAEELLRASTNRQAD